MRQTGSSAFTPPPATGGSSRRGPGLEQKAELAATRDPELAISSPELICHGAGRRATLLGDPFVRVTARREADDRALGGGQGRAPVLPHDLDPGPVDADEHEIASKPSQADGSPANAGRQHGHVCEASVAPGATPPQLMR